MKKKFFAIFAITAISMAFIGCGNSEKSTTTEATTELTTDVDVEEDTTEGTIEDTTEDTTEGTTEDTTENISDASNSDKKATTASRGTIEDGVYTNETFKVSFPISDDMTVFTDEEVLSILGVGQDIMSSNGMYTAEQIENALNGTIYDIMFAFPDGQSNVSVSYINLNQNGMTTNLSLDVYVDATMSQLEQMTSPKYTSLEKTTETYSGIEYTCINTKTDMGYSQKMAARFEGNYIVQITITYLDDSPELATDFLNSLLPVE